MEREKTRFIPEWSERSLAFRQLTEKSRPIFLFRGFLIPERRETNGKQKNGGMYNSYQTFFHFFAT